MRNLRIGFMISVATVVFLPGCSGPPPFVIKFDKIKDDGTGSLADAEKIMGGTGKEIPAAELAKEDDKGTGNSFAVYADKFKGKRKLVKGEPADVGERTVPDDKGAEVKWIRWNDPDKSGISAYVAVLDDKVFLKVRKGGPK